MRKLAQILAAITLALLPCNSRSQNAPAAPTFRMESLDEFEIHSAKLDAVEVGNSTVQVAN